MSERLTENFTRDEFACHCGCGRALVDREFVRRLQALREDYGRPMKITSGYRCPDHNAAVSSTGRDGPHTTGHAADFAVSGYEAGRLFSLAAKYGFTGRGMHQRGAYSARFVHLDDLPAGMGRTRPHVWTY